MLRFGALAVFAGLGAGCSADAIRLTDPIFTGSTSNQQAIISGRPAAYGQSGANAQSAAIESRPLPQPVGTPPPVQTAAVQPAYRSDAGKPRPYTPPKPYVASGQPKPLGTLPVKAAAPKPVASAGSYTVQPGDSLWLIARRNDTTIADLRAANNLVGNSIRPGQSLVIPGSGANAPVRVAAAAPVTMTDAPMPNPAPARKTKPQQVAVVQPRETAAKPAPYVPPTQKKPEEPAKPAPASSAAKPAEPVKTASVNASGFRWPVRGRIISGFGKKANGERNDGIDLAVPEGTSVKAAESGVVIYAGNELKSYGNLVLVKHENGWVSAYAHNKELLVKRGDKVQRGQVISRAGRSGGVDTPQVHFELRKGATPVDPMKYLSDV